MSFLQKILSKLYCKYFPRNGVIYGDTRPYTDGDDIRLINWPSTAKTGETIVNTLSKDSGNDIIIAIDTSASMEYSTQQQSKTKLAQSIINQLLSLSKTHHDKIGLFFLGTNEQYYVRPQNNIATIQHLIAQSKLINNQDLHKDIAALYHIIKKRSNIIIITDIFGILYDRKKIASHIHQLSAKHDISLIIINDKNDIIPHKIGIITLEDIETGDIFEINTNDHSKINYLHNKFQKYCETAINDLQKLGIRISLIETSMNNDDATLQFFQNIVYKKIKY